MLSAWAGLGTLVRASTSAATSQLTPRIIAGVVSLAHIDMLALAQYRTILPHPPPSQKLPPSLKLWPAGRRTEGSGEGTAARGH